MTAPHDSDLVRFVYLYKTEDALLATHVADHLGHCSGCSCGSAPPIWPCDLHQAATRVLELRATQQVPSWSR